MREVTFSKKYKPLFDLLQAWDVVYQLSHFGLNDKESDRLLNLISLSKIVKKHDRKKFCIDNDINIEYFKKVNKDNSILLNEIHELRYKSLVGQQINDLDYFITLTKVDTVLISGGRDSGKSFALSTFVPSAAWQFNHRLLYTRYTMSSTDNSITTALEHRMELLGIQDEFTYANNDYHLKSPEKRGKVSITGQKTSVGTQTAKLKSLEDYSIFITDEGEEIKSYEDWIKVKRSMRAKDVQTLSIISFNPPDKDHWMYERFDYDELEDGFNGIIDNVMYIHTTYLDNGRVNMAEQNWNEYEALRKDYELYKETKGDKREQLPPKIKKNHIEYKSAILGGFKDLNEGVIYEDWRVGEFPDNIPYIYGMDLGSSDPDAITKVGIDWSSRTAYIDEIHYKNNSGSAQLMQAIHEKIGVDDFIVSDSNERRLIIDLQDGLSSPEGEWLGGVNIEGVQKRGANGMGFVKYRISLTKSFTLVFTPRSKNCISSVRKYVWHDKRANVPRHEHSHLPNSWEYAIVELND